MAAAAGREWALPSPSSPSESELRYSVSRCRKLVLPAPASPPAHPHLPPRLCPRHCQHPRYQPFTNISSTASCTVACSTPATPSSCPPRPSFLTGPSFSGPPHLPSQGCCASSQSLPSHDSAPSEPLPRPALSPSLFPLPALPSSTCTYISVQPLTHPCLRGAALCVPSHCPPLPPPPHLRGTMEAFWVSPSAPQVPLPLPLCSESDR